MLPTLVIDVRHAIRHSNELNVFVVESSRRNANAATENVYGRFVLRVRKQCSLVNTNK